MGVKIIPVPALEDNYMYLIVDVGTGTAAVVDPVDPAAVEAAAAREGATIRTILTTHSHWDHDGGNVELKARCATVDAVVGGRGDGAKGCTRQVGDGDVVQCGETAIRVLFTPCHSPGHVCYYIDEDEGHVFTGDTMFVGGAGNFNTGTPQQMVQAFDKLLALPNATKVWVGHEYTCKNCQFASYAEPANGAIWERLAWAGTQQSIHAGGRGTVPSTIGDEKRTNPFARIDEADIKTFVGGFADRAERMRLVRKAKDDWGRGLRT